MQFVVVAPAAKTNPFGSNAAGPTVWPLSTNCPQARSPSDQVLLAVSYISVQEVSSAEQLLVSIVRILWLGSVVQPSLTLLSFFPV